MLNSMNALRSGNLKAVDDKMLYPLLRWCSGSQKDLAWCAKVNKAFFWLPADVAKGYIWVGLRDQNRFIKYPKGAKEAQDKVFDLKKSLLKKYYRWSEHEFYRNISVMEFVDWADVAMSLGCDDHECKALGVPISKPTIKKADSPKSKSIFDF